MSPNWRRTGESMGTIDLRHLGGSEVVIHFGGSLKSVDVYTFANSLVGFADTVRAVNKLVDPNCAIEVRVEAVIPPFLVGLVIRLHAACFSFMAGVMPPMPILGR